MSLSSVCQTMWSYRTGDIMRQKIPMNISERRCIIRKLVLVCIVWFPHHNTFFFMKLLMLTDMTIICESLHRKWTTIRIFSARLNNWTHCFDNLASRECMRCSVRRVQSAKAPSGHFECLIFFPVIFICEVNWRVRSTQINLTHWNNYKSTLKIPMLLSLRQNCYACFIFL